MRTRFLEAKIGLNNLLVKKQKNYPSSQRGFTLIEMIVVLGIIALLSGGVILAFSRMSSQAFIDNQMVQIKNLIVSYREKLRKGDCENIELLFSNYPPASVGIAAKCAGATPVQNQVQIQGMTMDIQYQENLSGSFSTKDSLYLRLSNSKAGVLQLVSGSTTASGPSIPIGNLDTFQASIKLTRKNLTKELKINKSNILYAFNF